MSRNIYIDLGANNGLTVRDFRLGHPDFIIFAFEPTPRLAANLRADFADAAGDIHVMEYAAWITDGVLDFYLGDVSDQSSTILTGKKAPKEWTVDYTSSISVPSIDFDRWLRETTTETDTIVVKMDVEGAEYRLLRRLIETGAIRRIKDLRVEWHWDRYPNEITREEHARIREEVGSLTKLTDWV